MAVVQVRQLVQYFDSTLVLDNISFDIQTNDVLGIIGPNGSGKTTLLSILVGLLKPAHGYLSFEPQTQIGALIESPYFYDHLTGEENLEIVGLLKKKNVNVPELFSLIGLSLKEAKKEYCNYSYGMKQRLGIAATLIGDPNLIVLDEPTNGVDPVGIIKIREIIKEIIARGKTVIITSHLLSEINTLCSTILVLQNGKNRFFGPKEELTKVIRPSIEIECRNTSTLQKEIQKLKGVIDAKTTAKDTLTLTVEPYLTTENLNEWCFLNGFVLSKITTNFGDLEKAFLATLQ